MVSSTESQANEKVLLEREKLKVEIRKITAEIWGLKRQHILDTIKATGAFVTAIVALVGVFLTFESQQKQLKSSVVTSKPANDGQGKTGQRGWPRT